METFEPERPWWLLPPKRVPSAFWLALAALMLWMEYVTGSYNHLPVLYVIPVCLAAWYSGQWPALTLAVGITAAHGLFAWFATPAIGAFTLIGTMTLRGSVIIVMALWFARLSEHERALEQEVRTLKGLLPICSFCKNIRNDDGDWERVEDYVARHSRAEFSHGVCPDCQETHYSKVLGGMRAAKVRRLAAGVILQGDPEVAEVAQRS